MKYTGPKAKRVRRHGTNIYGADKYDKILQRKPHKAGKSPRDRESRPSEFGRQLLEKQKLRDIYGLSEKQFRNLYEQAARVKGQTGDTLRQLLERRLDNVLYRSGFALTRMQARQQAAHGLFMVDGVRVTTPSYLVTAGQKIEARPRSKQSPMFTDIAASHEKYMPPAWLKVNSGSLQAEVVSLPDPTTIEQLVDIQQVVEFYSRS